MRKWLPLSIAMAIAIPFAASAETAATVTKQVTADLSKMIKSFEKHDMKAVSALYAEDYASPDQAGRKVGKAEAMKMTEHYMETTKKVNSAVYTVSGLTLKGDTAMGKTSFKLDAVITDPEGMFGAKGKAHKMKMTQLMNVTWTKTGGKWLISKETPRGMPDMTIDGKTFNPSAPPKPASKPAGTTKKKM